VTESTQTSAFYRLIGAEESPYSVKVRAYLRYKSLPHQWLSRVQAADLFAQHARLPLIPLVITPEGRGIQDSTPIILALEETHPEPSIHPTDPVARFVSFLLEEFGDEWGNKWMFHLRWAREADQQSTGQRIARTMMPGLGDEQYAGMATQIIGRMVGRVWFVGSNEVTAPQIEQSFRDGIAQLERHLESRPYLLGARPAFADFGLWGQVYNAWTDPTAGSIVEAEGPAVKRWIDRMLEPKAEGDFETWKSLEPTLAPFLSAQVGGLFLPWSDANARALAAGQEEFSVELASGTWTQKPQKYHARSLAALRERYAAVADRSALDPILASADCLRWMKA
jgi:glutathione S-transferase